MEKERKVNKQLSQTDYEKIVQDFTNGMPTKEIAKSFEIHTTSVCRILKRFGIATGKHRLTENQVREICKKYLAGAGLSALSREFKTSPPALRIHLSRQNIELKGVGGQRRKWSDEQIDKIIALYNSGNGMSQEKIGKMFDTDQHSISSLLRSQNVHVKKRWAQHPNWKGGRIVNYYGYVSILVEDSDEIGKKMMMSNGYVMEHRIVMARHLGRSLSRKETVHHIDGNKANNSIENLQLRQGKHGTGTVFKCLNCGSHNVESVEIS